jgi:hypothetical protein
MWQRRKGIRSKKFLLLEILFNGLFPSLSLPFIAEDNGEKFVLTE